MFSMSLIFVQDLLKLSDSFSRICHQLLRNVNIRYQQM